MDTHTDHNLNAPWNQIQVNEPEVVETWKNLTETYESGHEQVFKDKQNEILNDANILLNCLESIESGLAGKMRLLIEKLK